MKRTILFILTLAVCLTVSLSVKAQMNFSYNFKRAIEYYEDENYEDALTYLKKGIEANPRDFPCLVVMASIYSENSYARYAEALELTNKAFKLAGDNNPYWKSLIHEIKGDVFYKTGNYYEAEDEYWWARTYNSHTKANGKLAELLLETGKYKDVITLCSSCRRNDPSNPAWYNRAAYASIKLQKYDDAACFLRSSIGLQPTGNGRAYAYMGRLALARTGNTVEAVHWAIQGDINGGWGDYLSELVDTLVTLDFHSLETAALQQLEHQPNDKERLGTLRYIYYQNDMPVEAISYARQILALEDDNDYRPTLARMYASIGMYQEAMDEFQTALKNDTTLYHLNFDMYRHALRHAHYDEALTYIDKYISRENDDAQLLRRKAKIYQAQGQHQEAINLLETALAHSKEDGRGVIYLNLGQEYLALGQTDQGRSYLNMCTRMDIDHRDPRDSHYTIALAYAMLGDTAGVREHLDVLEQGTKDYEYFDLATVYALLGDTARTYSNLRHLTGTVIYNQGSLLLYDSRFSQLFDQPTFRAILAEQDSVLRARREQLSALQQAQDSASGTTEIPFSILNGVNQVRCTINGLSLYFVFDTGASDVTISSVEANFMLKNGYLTANDIIGRQSYLTASGEIHEGTVINLREVRVGDITLTNIKASVVSSQSAPLLLGQTVFRRFGTMEVDNTRKVIIFRK